MKTYKVTVDDYGTNSWYNEQDKLHHEDGPAIEYADGTIRNLGPNTRGMIRYTYFEDYTIPPISWTATNNQLLTDYFPKASKDSIEGKLKPNQMNY